jgi:hypothetical protein
MTRLEHFRAKSGIAFAVWKNNKTKTWSNSAIQKKAGLLQMRRETDFVPWGCPLFYILGNWKRA